MSPELQQVLRELAEIREQMDRITRDLASIRERFESAPPIPAVPTAPAWPWTPGTPWRPDWTCGTTANTQAGGRMGGGQ